MTYSTLCAIYWRISKRFSALRASIHTLAPVSPISVIEIGTSFTGPCFSDTMTVPLKVFVLPFILGLEVQQQPSSNNYYTIPYFQLQQQPEQAIHRK
jgi:hypothetical protein